MSRSIVLLGGPDSGKTNYIGRLWHALEAPGAAVRAAAQPTNLTFVKEVTNHLFQGHFAPRSELTDERRDFEVLVETGEGGPQTALVVPDISGELWRNAVTDSEIAVEWMSELARADGALLFVRVDSEQHVPALNWVTSRQMLERVGAVDDPGLPTQTMLCELIRFMETTLARRADGSNPRLSVVVSAWDKMDVDAFARGPIAFLQREYPMFAGRLDHLEGLDLRIFGLSVVGGDLNLEGFRDTFLDQGFDGNGWVAVPDGEGWKKDRDLTLPVAWVVGV